MPLGPGDKTTLFVQWQKANNAWGNEAVSAALGAQGKDLTTEVACFIWGECGGSGGGGAGASLQVFTQRAMIGAGSGTRSASPFLYNDQVATAGGQAAHMVSTAGVFRALRVTNPAGVLPSGAVTVSLYVNGVISALTGQISTTVAAFTTVADVAVVEGDTIDVRMAVGAGTGAHHLQLALDFDATAANAWCYGYGGFGPVVGGSGTETGLLFHGGPSGWLGAAAGDVAQVAGTLTKHWVRQSAISGAGNTRVFTIWKNGVAQDGTSGTPDTRATIGGATDLVASRSFSLPVAVGDEFKLKQTTTGAPATSARAFGSVEFVSAGLGLYGGSLPSTAPSTSVANYCRPAGQQLGLWDATELNVTFKNGPTPLVLHRLRVDTATAPGAGKSWTLTLRKNGAATALSAVVSGTGTSATVVATVTIADGDLFALECVPSGTPTTPGNLRWSFGVGTP